MQTRTGSERVTAVILAGGEGTRAGGRDKGLIELDGRPLVEHVLARIAPQVDEVVLSIARNAEGYARYGQRLLFDQGPAYQGPLSGIRAALGACTTPWLATVPVDACGFPTDLVARLLRGCIDAGAVAAVAHDGARTQPLFAIYRSDLAPVQLDVDAVWRFQSTIGALVVPFADACFDNLNEWPCHD